MPYIHQDCKNKFNTDSLLNDMKIKGVTPGELNYLFTTLAIGYMKIQGLSYTHINDVLGALEGCKQEFYRRMAVPFEDVKILKNGDVYGNES